jgi:hypothetical protein
MVTETLSLAIVAVSAIFGAILSGTLGWFDSGEAFYGRKFASTIIRAVIAGIIIAVGFNYIPDANILLEAFVALIAGAGIDVLGHRAAGAVTPKVVEAAPA